MKHTTIKIWVETHRKLRILAALLNKSMVEVLDNLVNEALKHVGFQGTQDST